MNEGPPVTKETVNEVKPRNPLKRLLEQTRALFRDQLKPKLKDLLAQATGERKLAEGDETTISWITNSAIAHLGGLQTKFGEKESYGKIILQEPTSMKVDFYLSENQEPFFRNRGDQKVWLYAMNHGDENYPSGLITLEKNEGVENYGEQKTTLAPQGGGQYNLFVELGNENVAQLTFTGVNVVGPLQQTESGTKLKYKILTKEDFAELKNRIKK